MTACSDVLCSRWKACQTKVRLARILESKQQKHYPKRVYFARGGVLRSGIRHLCGRQNAVFVLESVLEVKAS